METIQFGDKVRHKYNEKYNVVEMLVDGDVDENKEITCCYLCGKTNKYKKQNFPLNDLMLLKKVEEI